MEATQTIFRSMSILFRKELAKKRMIEGFLSGCPDEVVKEPGSSGAFGCPPKSSFSQDPAGAAWFSQVPHV